MPHSGSSREAIRQAAGGIELPAAEGVPIITPGKKCETFRKMTLSLLKACRGRNHESSYVLAMRHFFNLLLVLGLGLLWPLIGLQPKRYR